MMHQKLSRIFVGMALAVLLIGCTSPAGTTVAPAPSIPAPTQATAVSSDPTSAPEKVSNFDECLRSPGSLLQEDYDPPQCVTKDGKVFPDKGGASAEAIRPTVAPKEPGTVASASSLSAQGPWLFYVYKYPRPGMYDVADVPPELLLLNQDGTGRTPVKLLGCFDGSSQPETDATLAKFDSWLYLIHPAEAAAMLVQEDRPYPTCETYFHGDETGGLLAGFNGTQGDRSELIVYDLPAGTIRDRFPLVECSADQNTCDVARSIWDELYVKPQWSPNGRYLAYVALVDASTDLFVYDAQERSIRRLTQGPDWAGPIEWSPDGSQIIMQELLNQDLVENGTWMTNPSSVWAVSVSGNELRQLYLTNAQYGQQNIFEWLDNERFIAYEGSLDPIDGALNPRLVDMKKGTDRLLLDDWFGTLSIDPVHETIALFKPPTEKSPDGLYMISLESGTVRRVGDDSYSLVVDEWDPKTGLFVSSWPCMDDPQALQAFDYLGNLKCVPQPVPTPTPLAGVEYPSPDGKQSLTVKDGVWLESEGQAEIQIIPEDPSDVTWCPDSTCFFFSIPQPDGTWSLYHVSLPGQEVTKVDDGIQSTGSYQWLGVEK